MDDYDYLFKLILVGDSGVGKSTIVKRYDDNVFTEIKVPTVGVDFCIKTVPVDISIVRLQIWDTAGQERFRSITHSYYRSADAMILVYDIGDLESFRSLPEWFQEMEHFAGENIHRILIGNKSDLAERMVETKIGLQFANEHGMEFLETSAKYSKNIDELFENLAKELRNTHKDRKLTRPLDTQDISSYSSNSQTECSKKCC